MSANDNAATAFTSYLVASDKSEWLITVEGVKFALVRSEPALDTWMVSPDKAVDVVDDWALFVLADNGERVQVGRESGMRMEADTSGKRPTVAAHTQFRLARLMERASDYVEGRNRLTVMLEMILSNPENTSKKAINLLQSAALALRFHQVIISGGATFAVVAGEAVLIVSKYRGSWVELTYRIGSQAVHGSYNVSYIGKVTSISPKTVTVVEGSKTRRMPHASFVRYNSRPISAAHRRNAEWYD